MHTAITRITASAQTVTNLANVVLNSVSDPVTLSKGMVFAFPKECQNGASSGDTFQKKSVISPNGKPTPPTNAFTAKFANERLYS